MIPASTIRYPWHVLNATTEAHRRQGWRRGDPSQLSGKNTAQRHWMPGLRETGLPLAAKFTYTDFRERGPTWPCEAIWGQQTRF